jgi:hypothetical protein
MMQRFVFGITGGLLETAFPPQPAQTIFGLLAGVSVDPVNLRHARQRRHGALPRRASDQYFARRCAAQNQLMLPSALR